MNASSVRLKSKRTEFLTLGGNSVLDFCNTLVVHGDFTEDRLKTQKTARSFFKTFYLSNLNPTASEFSSLIKFRKLLRSHFEQVILGSKLANQKDPLANFLKGVKVSFDWNPDTKSFSRPVILGKGREFMQPLLLEFFEFSRNLDWRRLKICANKNCSHFFYDATKNSTRVWCSMKTCGNLIKARNFQKRRRPRLKS